MSKLTIDFETQSAADLIVTGSHVYAKHPSTKILCMAYAFDDEQIHLWLPTEPLPKRVRDFVLSGGAVYAYNMSGFELLIWNVIGVFSYGFPKLKLEQCHDVLAFAYAMALPGKLEHAAPAAGIQHEKDMKGHRIMLKLSQPKKDGSFWTPETAPDDFLALYQYCRQDVEVERELEKRLVPLSEKEKLLWELDHKINARGVYIDVLAVRAAIKIINNEVLSLDTRMKSVTKGVVEACTNVKALVHFVRSHGVETPGVAKADVTELLSKEDLPVEVRQALMLRQEAGKSSTAKLESMINSVSADGRIKGCFQYHGASTGRFAGRRVQLQNMPRPKIKQKQIEEIFEILSLVGGNYASGDRITTN